MADKKWIENAAQRRKDAHTAAAQTRAQERKALEERESLVAPFWDAFVDECEVIVKHVNASVTPPAARLKRSAERVLGVSFETHRIQVSLPRDSMLLHLDGIDRAKVAGAGAALDVRGNRVVGANGETPQELANEVMRVFFELAL